MKLVITAGGGGHFAPVIPVLEALKKEDEVLVIGRKYAFESDNTVSFEYLTAQERGIPFKSIRTGRIQRSVTRKSVSSLFKVPVGLMEAYTILKSFNPDVVLSFGGYVTFPVVLAASVLRIPIVIHEQTFQAGLANKAASPFAQKICISWETSKKYFPAKKTILTGNPLRKEFLLQKKGESAHPFFKTEREIPTLCVIGGSLGSHAINIHIEKVLPYLLSHYKLFHQTGDAKEFEDFDRLQKSRSLLQKTLQDRYFLTKFIPVHEVADVLSHADIVISRAGINTVTELMYLKKPTLFIPLPSGQKNEQVTNAQFMREYGIAEIIEQKQLTEKTFFDSIERLLQKRNETQDHLQNSLHASAAQAIVKIVYETQKNNK